MPTMPARPRPAPVSAPSRAARLLSRLPARLRAALAALALVPALSLAGGAAQAQGEYRVNRGDVLRIEVLEDDSLSRSVLVAPSGQVTVPLAGSVAAAGRSLSAVQAEVRDLLAPNFSNPPTVFVSLEQVRQRVPAGPAAPPATLSVFVLGEVGTPGELQLAPGTTLLQAFARMGGFSDFAAKRRIQLRRTDPRSGAETIYPINYDAILAGQSPNGTVVLAEGDVIVVPTRRLFE